MALRSTLGAAAAGVLIVLWGAAPALGATGTANVATSTEAWYSTTTAEACTQLDCSLLPPASAYPEHTLHVGVTAGKPAAATFLELDFFGADLPQGAETTGGKLTLPIDTAPGDGSLQHDAAKLVVCHVTDFFFNAEGALTKPPKTDCDGASAPAEYQDGPKPSFTVDLAAFAAKWAAGDTPALAVLPAPEAASGNETWHVTFWGKDNEAEGAAPIAAEVKYTQSSTGPGPSTGGNNVIDLGDPVVPEIEPLPAPPVDISAPEMAEAPVAAAPVTTNEPAPEAAPQPQAMPRFLTVGYPYRIAWTFPLLLLVGFGFTGQALTKKLEPTA